MSVVVNCKRCGKELRAKDRYAGMATRCPQCGTINQLPSLPKAVPPKKASPPAKPAGKPVGKTTGAAPKPAADRCTICGKPIRGKAERFTDVHGTVYHLVCYQKQAGDAPEDVCRICRKAFQTPKERVKDVVGFYYHRKCYQEELQRQKEAASGAKPKPSTQSASKAHGKSKPAARPKPARKPAPIDEDWDLTPDEGEVDDGWMRPDPDDLMVEEQAESTPPPKPVASAPKPPAQPSADSQARHARAKEDTPKPVRPEVKSPKEEVKKPPSASARLAPPAGRRAGAPPSSPKPKPAKPSTSGSPPSPIKKASGSSKPNDAAAATPKGSSTKRPLRRAKPIEERPSPPPPMPDDLELLPDEPAGMPDDLELLPDEPDALPDGLELLPDKPKDEIVEGLELLDDSRPSVIPTAVPPSSSSSTSLGGLTPFDPFAAAPSNALGPANPFEPSAFAQPEAVGPSPRSSDNSIPTWLWGVMGLAIAVVVVMLLASMMTAMFSSGSNDRAVADADRPTAEEPDGSESRQGDADRQEDARDPFGETDPFEENPYEWEDDSPQGEGFLPDNRPPQARRPRPVPPPRPEWARPPREFHESPPRRSTESDKTLLSEWHKFRTQSRNAGGGAWVGFVFGLIVGLAIYLGVSALALRFSCNMCGEPRASEFRMVGICICQLVVCILLAVVTSPLNVKVAGVICLPLQCAANIALVRFVLPTTNGRAISIAICHMIMSIVVAFVLIVIVVVMVLATVISAA